MSDSNSANRTEETEMTQTARKPTAEILEDATHRLEHLETYAVLTLSPGTAIGINVAGGLEGVAAVAAEILAGEDRNTPFLLDVEGDVFSVYSSGTFHPRP